MKQILFCILALMLIGCSPLVAYEPTSTQATMTTEPPPTLAEVTPTPTSTTPALCVVNVPEALNLRSGPGTNHAVKRVLSPGDVVTRIAAPTALPWIYVRTQDGATGWVNSIYCKE